MTGNADPNKWTATITTSSNAPLPSQNEERGERRTGHLFGITYHSESLIGQRCGCFRYHDGAEGINVEDAGKLTLPRRKERAHRQSNLISQLHKLTYFQLFLTLASLSEQTQINQYNVLILDILHLVYRGVRPKDLVRDQARVSISSRAYRLELICRDRWIN
jgi:hypothetical protein